MMKRHKAFIKESAKCVTRAKAEAEVEFERNIWHRQIDETVRQTKEIEIAKKKKVKDSVSMYIN